MNHEYFATYDQFAEFSLNDSGLTEITDGALLETVDGGSNFLCAGMGDVNLVCQDQFCVNGVCVQAGCGNNVGC